MKPSVDLKKEIVFNTIFPIVSGATSIVALILELKK